MNEIEIIINDWDWNYKREKIYSKYNINTILAFIQRELWNWNEEEFKNKIYKKFN